ncbi:Serine carboxypeptidase [Phytophthora cinnamomi]|uniref:Serine carboxypeptidase n=1 Tax=Phytophthora cinnamomi TaxID=4785 RepID=UPI00355A9338|nr:Serine carboxypeptidase [Phytophthora cinnamomi]
MKALQRSTPEDIITSEQCGDLLLRAEHHTRHSGYLRSIPEAHHTNHRHAFRLITLNNLACHAKHTGKPIAAVGFLERALKLQVKYQGTEPSIPDHEIALNRLNLCAVLSQLNRHVAAAAHAKAAVALLSTAEEASDKLNAEGSQLLLVAHYNLAVELEHLSDHDAAWRQYELVIAVAERHQLRHDLVESVRAILSQESLKLSSKSPRARTPRELYKPQRRPLSPKTLRVTQSMRTIFEAGAWGGDFISGQLGADQVIMSVGNGDGDELETPGVPLLYLGNNAPVDETLALSISIVATATVDPAVQEAVEELAQAVVGATQWFADTVRGELISQAAITVDTPVTKPVEEENKHDSSSPIVSPLRLGEHLPIVNRPQSAIIHVVAKAAVDAAIHGAVKQVIRAVDKATEWITQAVENELVSQAVDPAEGTTIHNVTEWITQAVRSELVAHAVADAIPLSDTSTISMDADTPEVPVHDAPRLSLHDEPSIAAVRELAKVTAEAAVSIALQSVAQAIGDASNWLTQAARGELLAEAVIEASPGPDDVPQVDEILMGLIAPQQQPSPSTEDYLINVPALQLPNSAPVSSVVMTELAVPFVNEVVASALNQAVPVSSPEPEDEGERHHPAPSQRQDGKARLQAAVD